ncbi:HEXIM protein-like [Arapaima gigas]
MSDADEQKSHQPKTSHAPSGGSAAILEHHAANENGRLHCADRGRYTDGQQADGGGGGGGGGTVAENVWNKQGGQQKEVCPSLAVGNAQRKCPTASGPEGHAAGALVAHGNSEETLSQAQGESGGRVARGGAGTGSSGARPQPPGDARLGKKRHRRRPSKKKRRWKPYFKLSWEEKKELDERETARAARVRAEMFAKGLPVAPYNTTQFLMEEHDREEPDLNTELACRRFLGAARSEDTASDDGIGGAGGEFLQRDFSETYERYHVESLQNMTKQELVREYLELEKCMSRLEEENNRLRRTRSAQDAQDACRLRELESELEQLRAQNDELRAQSQQLKERERVGSGEHE